MPDYQKMYFALFNAVTTAIDQLQEAQREGENTYIESDNAPLTILHSPKDEKPKDDG